MWCTLLCELCAASAAVLRNMEDPPKWARRRPKPQPAARCQWAGVALTVASCEPSGVIASPLPVEAAG
jgi:hypothetical protein